MNLRAELALSLAAHGAPLPSLFFRPADQARLAACVAAVTREGRSLAVIGQNDAALDHYADLLIHQLRREATCAVEIYFPASTQAMVSRFDELLAGMTVQEAMSEAAQAAPARIWLVHDAGALAEHELQLLARLVGNFPGAGVRVVLLLGPGVRSRQGFDALGRRFVRWDIETPSPEQALAMQALAREEGCGELVTELLRYVQPVRPQVGAGDSPPALGQAPGKSLLASRPPAKSAGRPQPEAASQLTRGSQARQRRGWLVGALLVSAFVMASAGVWLGLQASPWPASWWEQPVRQWLRTDVPGPAAAPRLTSEQRT